MRCYYNILILMVLLLCHSFALGSNIDSRNGNLYKFVQPEDFSGGLHGFVIGGTTEHTAKFYTDLSGYGANLIRVFFKFGRCKTCHSYGRATADIAILDTILKAAKHYNFKVVVVGEFQEITTGDFWMSRELQDSMIENWTWFARHYINNEEIAGFDLLNEPNLPWPHELPENYIYWHPLAQKITDAIRNVDSNHVIIIESAPGASPEGFKYLTPVIGDHIVYSLHFYAPHEITHQLVSNRWNRSLPYPAGAEYGLGKWDAVEGVGRWDKARLFRLLKDARNFSKKYNAYIYVGEFSCVRWAPMNSSTRYIKDALELFHSENWSWTYHEFRGWPGWDAEIAGNDKNGTREVSSPTIMELKRSMEADRLHANP